MILLMLCKECNEEVEVLCDGDGPSMCPECRSVDCFKDIKDYEAEKRSEALFELMKNRIIVGAV